MILGFKTKVDGKLTLFMQKILACVMDVYAAEYIPKKHTIRAGKRWNAGMKLHLATGVRTKEYFQFNENIKGLEVCKCVQSIEIKHYGNDLYILIDDQPYAIFKGEYTSDRSKMRLNTLAQNDGFDCFADFKNWFNSDFEGQIIHWTDLKY